MATDSRHLQTPELPNHILIAGIDASGKSTFLINLSEQWGCLPLEPTSTDEARTFRRRNADEPVTADLIAAREQLFLGINEEHSQHITERLAAGTRVATTGNSLVTRLSHAVMRGVAVDQTNPAAVVYDWLASGELRPEALFLTHAPFEVIRKRIMERQQTGDKLERFWAFNSLFFLDQYQDAWLGALETVGRETDIICRGIDTSRVAAADVVPHIERSLL